MIIILEIPSVVEIRLNATTNFSAKYPTFDIYKTDGPIVTNSTFSKMSTIASGSGSIQAFHFELNKEYSIRLVANAKVGRGGILLEHTFTMPVADNCK